MVFGVYMLVSVIVLINLLIAMMSDTYQRIQVPQKLSIFLPNNIFCHIKKFFSYKFMGN